MKKFLKLNGNRLAFGQDLKTNLEEEQVPLVSQIFFA